MGSVRGRIFTATGSPNGLMRSHVRRMLRVIFKQNASESINIAVLRSGRLYSNRCACNLWSSHSRQEEQFLLAENPKTATVADLFRRAQDLRNENAQASYKEIAAQLVRECSGTPFPPTYNLTIPEQDARAPEEDWSAGLPLVLRGIQQKDWNDIAQGIVLCWSKPKITNASAAPKEITTNGTIVRRALKERPTRASLNGCRKS